MNAVRLSVVVVTLHAVLALASDPTIPYQGRVSAGGADHTGTGYFKFTILYAGGRWSNDGSGPTGEPTTAVAIEVNNGLFSIELGNTNVTNMTRIPAAVFHRPDLGIRTWFSTNNANFQLLSPDATLRPTDFGKIHTGNAYIVDCEGSGDFREIQDAVNYLLQEGISGTVVVMPGFYACTVGDNGLWTNWTPSITIEGVGKPWIENGLGGAAVTAWPNLVIKGVMLRGAPAIVMPPSGDHRYWRNIELRECEFVANRPETTAAVFQGTSTVDIVDCEFWGDSPTTTAMRVTGDVQINASRCSFSSWRLEGSGVVLDRVYSSCLFEHCTFNIEHQGLHSLRIVGTMDDPWRHVDFNDCSFHGPVAGQGSVKGLRFRRTLLWSGRPLVPVVGLTGGNSDQIEFRQCELSGDEAVPTVVLADGMSRGFTARDTTFSANQARAIEMRNEWSGIRLENCHVTANSSEAIWLEVPAVEVTPVRNSAINVWRSTVEAWGMGSPHTAMVITGAQENVQNYGDGVAPYACVSGSAVGGYGDCLASWWSEIRLRNSDVGWCPGTGVRIQGGQLVVSGTEVDADGEGGVVAIASEVDIDDGSVVSGGGVGVHMQDGDLGITGSKVDADDKAIVITGNSSLGLVNSEISADDEDAGTGTGISANFASTQCHAYVIGSLAYGMVAGMDLGTGTYTVANCSLASETTVAVLRDPANITTFDGCRMLGLSKESTAPIVNLVGNAGAFPKPKILGCSLRSVSTNAYWAVDTTGPGTAQIIMNLTSLSTNFSTSVTNVASSVADNKGNVIVP
jgi:hypothetical protein